MLGSQITLLVSASYIVDDHCHARCASSADCITTKSTCGSSAEGTSAVKTDDYFSIASHTCHKETQTCVRACDKDTVTCISNSSGPNIVVGCAGSNACVLLQASCAYVPNGMIMLVAMVSTWAFFEIVWSLLQGRRKVEIRKSLRVSRQRAVLLNMVRRLQVLYSERFGTRQGTFFWSRMLFRSTLQVFIQASFFISKSSTMDTSEVYLRSAMLIVGSTVIPIFALLRHWLPYSRIWVSSAYILVATFFFVVNRSKLQPSIFIDKRDDALERAYICFALLAPAIGVIRKVRVVHRLLTVRYVDHDIRSGDSQKSKKRKFRNGVARQSLRYETTKESPQFSPGRHIERHRRSKRFRERLLPSVLLLSGILVGTITLWATNYQDTLCHIQGGSLWGMAFPRRVFPDGLFGGGRCPWESIVSLSSHDSASAEWRIPDPAIIRSMTNLENLHLSGVRGAAEQPDGTVPPYLRPQQIGAVGEAQRLGHFRLHLRKRSIDGGKDTVAMILDFISTICRFDILDLSDQYRTFASSMSLLTNLELTR